MDPTTREALISLVTYICGPLVGLDDESTMRISPPPAVEYGIRSARLIEAGAGVALDFDPGKSQVETIELAGADIAALLAGSADTAAVRTLFKAIGVALFEILMRQVDGPRIELRFE